MSWLNTVLNVASVSMEVAQLNKLEELRQQGAATAVIEGVLQALRDEIFKYKQAADEILAREQEDPVVAAAMMKILHLRLDEFGITPDLFPDINDKEYVASTKRLIRENSNRLMEQLSAEERAKVDVVVSEAMLMPDYDFYIEHYEDVQRYRKALPVYNQLQARNSACLQVIGMLLLLFLVPTVLGTIGAGVGGTIGGAALGVIAAFAGLGMGLVVVLATMLYYRKNVARSNEYLSASEAVQKTNENVDLKRFKQLEEDFGKDYDRVAERYQEAQILLEDFFGDSDWTPQMLPG